MEQVLFAKNVIVAVKHNVTTSFREWNTEVFSSSNAFHYKLKGKFTVFQKLWITLLKLERIL